ISRTLPWPTCPRGTSTPTPYGPYVPPWPSTSPAPARPSPATPGWSGPPPLPSDAPWSASRPGSPPAPEGYLCPYPNNGPGKKHGPHSMTLSVPHSPHRYRSDRLPPCPYQQRKHFGKVDADRQIHPAHSATIPATKKPQTIHNPIGGSR